MVGLVDILSPIGGPEVRDALFVLLEVGDDCLPVCFGHVGEGAVVISRCWSRIVVVSEVHDADLALRFNRTELIVPPPTVTDDFADKRGKALALGTRLGIRAR